MRIAERNKITYLSFIMSVLVILIHSINNETKFQRFFSIDFGIGQFAVPLFFVISGFLFFRNLNTTYDLKRKLRTRVYTVFVPYILWNVIYYLLHKIANPGDGFSFIELYNATFNYIYNPSFWFICQLLLLFAISPIIYLLYKKVLYLVLGILLMLALVYLNIDIPYINEDAIIYYISGAIMSKLYDENKIDLICKKNIIFTFIGFFVAFIVNRVIILFIGHKFITVSLFTASIIHVRVAAVLFIFYLCDLFFSYDRIYKFMEHTFFLYAIHYAIVKFIIIITRYISYKFLKEDYYVIIETIAFIISPFACVIANYYLSDFMIKKFPKVYYLLVGNRK